jgi:hypothetical protein
MAFEKGDKLASGGPPQSLVVRGIKGKAGVQTGVQMALKPNKT